MPQNGGLSMTTLKGFRVWDTSGIRPWISSRRLVVALAIFYALVVYGGSSLKDDYSHISQYISELNASSSSWSWQIGYLGFLPLGLLGFLLLLVVVPQAKLSGISQIGGWMLVAEPVAYIGSALAPCDLGCPIAGSFSQNIHNLLSVVTLPVTTLGLVLLSLDEKLTLPKRMGWLVLAATFISLYALALVPALAPWKGLLQRAAEGILYGSLCIVGWRVLSSYQDVTERSGHVANPTGGYRADKWK